MNPPCPPSLVPDPLNPDVLHTLQVAGREPARLLERTWAEWRTRRERALWVFGYASLIWNPEILHSHRVLARVHGYHRALRMWSRVNRGTPERPGLVFALMPGGACRGLAMRVDARHARDELERLWAREMPTGVYEPVWLPCRTPEGPLLALGFTLSRRSPSYTGLLDDAALVEILRSARGRYGTTLDYVARTHRGLHEAGIRDTALSRLIGVARRHGLPVDQG